MMQALTPLVQPISIDEAFLDLAGTEKLHGMPPALVLARFARNLEKEVGISASVGLSYCKFLAKIASDTQKPRGFAVIGEEEAVGFLADKPVTLIWGVGKAFDEVLERDGIRTVGQLQKMERGDLMKRYGTMGDRLYHLSRGMDERRVHADHEAKSVSAETTFDKNRLLGDLAPVIEALAERVWRQHDPGARRAHTVVIKLKTSDFRIVTRSKTPASPPASFSDLNATALALLAKIDLPERTRYRLAGVGLSNFREPEDTALQPQLF